MNPLARYFIERFSPDSEDSAFSDLLTQAKNSLENGNTVTLLDTPPVAPIKNLLITAKMAEEGVLAPLVYQDNQLWLYRIWHLEQRFIHALMAHAQRAPLPLSDDAITAYLDRLNIDHSARHDSEKIRLNAKQIAAIAYGLRDPITIINGGPGTGKTFTLAHLVIALTHFRPTATIALAAPTGKAAKRIEASLQQTFDTYFPNLTVPSAQTLHRLIGIGHNSSPNYDANNPLPYDYVIIDEASMLSLALSMQLFDALAADTSLILLGDAHQLAAIEPGAIFHDMLSLPSLAGHIVTLTQSHRFSPESGIGKLARWLIDSSSNQTVTEILNGYTDIRWQHQQDVQLYDALFAPYQDFLALLDAEMSPNCCLQAFEQYRILTPTHSGNSGVDAINYQMRIRHLAHSKLPTSTQHYHGQPVLITANDPTNKIFNGDIGLCLRRNNAQHSDGIFVYFPHLDEPIPLSRIQATCITDAYAMTIHKSQGSEYAHVALVVDSTVNKILSRELLYTAVTRAKNILSLYANTATLNRARASPIVRSTGIKSELAR